MTEKIFPVYSLVLILVLGLISFSSTAQVVQDKLIQTGIYEIDYTTDTTLLHTKFKKYNKQPDKAKGFNLTNVYQHQYSNLIDPKYKIKYAMVIRESDANDKEKYKLQMIWLNEGVPENYSVTYNDTIPRKFMALETYINFTRNNWNEIRYAGNGNFLQYPNLDDYKDSYKYQYNPDNLLINKNEFILKSKQVELITDRVKVDSSTYYSIPLYGNGYKTAATYYTFKQPLITFKLKEAIPYQSFLYIDKKVKFYTGVKATAVYQYLNPGDFIAVTKETDEWYQGEHVSINGERLAGRIFIDDLLSDKVKTQLVNKLELKIRYSVSDDENKSFSEIGTIDGIKVYKNKQLVQVIKKPGLLSDSTQLINVVDVNFDGYPDLEIYSHDGGAGPNNGYNYYIYNPARQRFIYNSTLSDLTQTSINTKSKSISAAWRNGAGNHGFEKYKWIKGRLTLVEYYETRYLEGDNVEETHNKMINGKMKNRSRTVREDQLRFPETIVK